MEPSGGNPSPEAYAQAALRAVSLLHQLTVEAIQSRSLAELAFRLVNRTHALTPYDRAALITSRQHGGKVLAISGLSRVEPMSGPVRWLKAAARRLPVSGGAVQIDDSLLESIPGWQDYSETALPGHVAWVPLFASGGPAGGIWLERRARSWTQGELALLDQLAVPYAELLLSRTRPTLFWRAGQFLTKRLVILIAAAALVLTLVRIPMRVVAPCELAPLDPYPVTAPLAGVIAQALVEPGQSVTAGQALFEYDKRVALEELNLARQQVRLLESSLSRSRMQAFGDPKAKAEIALLEIKLEQERIRLALSESNVSRLDVKAGAAGVVAMDDPDQWRGRPVTVGEKLLTLVNPERVKLRIWLPVDDNLPFEPDAQVMAYLTSLPDTVLKARLTYVARNVSQSPGGVLGVAAEATLDAPPRDAHIGVQGSAVLHGPRVSLAYWMLRRPLAWVRGKLGV